MNKPYHIKFTQEEKNKYSLIAQQRGISLEELINILLLEALQENSTGIYDAYRGYAGGHGASG